MKKKPSYDHAAVTPAQRKARRQNAATATNARQKAAAARRAEAAAELEAVGVPPYSVSEARLMAAKAALAERELATHEGRYLDVEQARADVSNLFAIVRTRLLAVPSRMAQQGVQRAAVAIADDLIREALSELADGDTNNESLETNE